jgi:hypothetical protein
VRLLRLVCFPLIGYSCVRVEFLDEESQCEDCGTLVVVQCC